MWKSIEVRDEDGKPIGGKEGKERAREHFCVRDPGCPVIECEGAIFAVWCAAPLAQPKDYPALHWKPLASSKYASIHDANQ